MTTTDASPDTSPKLAVMVAVPSLIVLTRPTLDTVAMDSSEVVQVARPVTSSLVWSRRWATAESGMLWSALENPDPVLLFQHALLYNLEGELAEDAGPVGIDRAAVRRAGKDLSLITYGGTLPKTLAAADVLSREGIDAEVLDLRTLRPLDNDAILETAAKTGRVVVIDEGWKTGGISAEISARIVEGAFANLKAAPERVCSAEVPMPYAKHLEDAALPQTETIVRAARKVLHG